MQSRRRFLQTATRGAAGLALLPNIIPARLLGADAPSRRLQIAQIGCGRMGRSDLRDVLAAPIGQVVAVCDLDSNRLAAAQQMVEAYYTKNNRSFAPIKTYHDYREVLASPEIDAVVITVPDHSHARLAIEAAIAGKHIYVQKPVTYNIAESIGLRRAVEAKKIILQTGSQQRSEHPYGSFRAASAAVRNGRIGRLHTVKIGVGIDKPSGHAPAAMPVPANLDYEHWLGSAPQQDYMELRVHSQKSLEGRPGWITTEDFGLGMITNWGAHHMDIAQWAMGQELGGPLTVEAKAKFMTNDCWTVHREYHVEMLYPNNVQVILDDKFENGIRFEGEEGWIFCKRGAERVTASDPNATDADRLPSLRASNPNFLKPSAADTVKWPASKEHHLNWLESILAGTQPIAPIQQSARSVQACCTAWISMKLGRKVTWDPITETFPGDAEANALRSRKARKPEYDFELTLQRAGIV